MHAILKVFSSDRTDCNYLPHERFNYNKYLIKLTYLLYFLQAIY